MLEKIGKEIKKKYTNKNRVKGAIDKYDNGLLYGWAYDAQSPERIVEVKVIYDDECIGEGTASLYREDLKIAGIGEGKHGFEARIRPLPIDGRAHKLSLLDSETGLPIEAKPFTFQQQNEKSVRIEAVTDGIVRGVVTGNFDNQECISVILLTDSGKQVEGAIATIRGDGSYYFSITTPPHLMDGMPHVLTVALPGCPGVEANYAGVLPSIFTPWEYLSSSSREMGYPALPRTAGYRYDSLRLHLSNRQDHTDMEMITLAHNIVVEGWHKRMQFPRLCLPKVSQPKVSVVIPVYNQFELTYHCIASLILAWNKASYEVILIDDCSTDQTTEIVEIVDNLVVIRNEQNLGFLKNCNKAAAAANGQYLVMLNNDTEVTSGWLDELLTTFNHFDGVGMAGSKLLYPDGRLQEAGGIVWGNGQPWNLGKGGNPQATEWNYARQVDYLSGAAIMVKRSVWELVGGFSDEFAPAYYEDTDIAFKIREAGYKTVYSPYSIVIHFEGMSNGKDITTGVKKNQTINAPKFRAKWIDSYLNNGEPSWSNVWQHKDRNIAYRVLMIDHAAPRPDQDAGSYAAVQEMRMLQGNGCKVTFLAENMAHMGKYTDNLQKMGIECAYAPFFTSVHDFLKKRGHEFDIVYITRFQVAERHLEQVRLYTRAKVLFNNADLHFLRELRTALAAQNKDLSGPLATRDRELAVMRQVDGILSYNETEHAVILSHNLRGDNLYICPWVLDARGHRTPWAERNGIAFLGGYGHPPNAEAVEYFVTQIMPLLRKRLPGVAFHIYGSNMPDTFKQYEADDVILEGFVEHLDEIFEKIRVFVAPLLSGAGIKGKVLEAMSAGVPSVLTPIAAEATGLSHGVNAMIVQEPDSWVEAIAELYENENCWQQVSQNALAIAQSNYSFVHGVGKMKKIMEGVGVYPPNKIKSLTAKY